MIIILREGGKVMAWTTEGPESKFQPGDSARYIGDQKDVTSVANAVVFIIGATNYHVEIENYCYLARFPGDAIIPVWEDELELLSAAVVSRADRPASEPWHTRGLLRRYRHTVAKSQAITQWLESAKRVLAGTLINVTADGMWPLGIALFVLGLASSLITLGVTYGGENPSGRWPWFGWFFVALGITGLGTWTALGVPAFKLTKVLRESKRREQMQDPLWQRAELILKASGELKLHLDRFETWFNAIDQGLQKKDEALAGRYHDFLVRAHLVLERAINNFTQAASLTERQTRYLKDHPEMAQSAESTHLAELMVQLNQPVEIPDALALMDTRRALEHEEAVAQLVQELDERELARRIEALPGASSSATAESKR